MPKNRGYEIQCWMILLLAVSTIVQPTLAFPPVIPAKKRQLKWESISRRKSRNMDHENPKPTSKNPPPANFLSDEELLLACRAYLQKKNRLGKWTEFERRREFRVRQQKVAKGSETGGFFWDDPTELKYFRSNPGDREDPSDYSESVALLDEEEDLDDELLHTTDSASKNTMSASRLDQIAFGFQDDHSHSSRLEQWSREFSSFPVEPSETRLKRSQAALRKWNDPEWKAKWQQCRWGGHQLQQNNGAPKAPKSQREKEKRAAAVSVDFLGSPEFISLSEDEIVEAVAIYTQANVKRSVSRLKALQERKAKLTESKESRVPLDALSWDRDPQALKEARRRRSERAHKAYQSRLEKQQGTTTMAAGNRRISKPSPRGTTPQDALLRIESDLDSGKMPSGQDLEFISAPRKLAKRKNLLRRILLEVFGLRGKCVPIPKEDDPDSLQFITNCNVDQLMAFVQAKVREKESEPFGGD